VTTHALLQGVKVDRVTAQSIMTGTPEREREQSVDFGKTVVTQRKYLELLQKSGNQLKIQYTGEPLVLVQCLFNLRQCRRPPNIQAVHLPKSQGTGQENNKNYFLEGQQYK
jgi:hypothetical protein